MSLVDIADLITDAAGNAIRRTLTGHIYWRRFCKSANDKEG